MSRQEDDALGTPTQQNQNVFELTVEPTKAEAEKVRKSLDSQIGDTCIPVRDSKHITINEV
jgi:hypothetical protein